MEHFRKIIKAISYSFLGILVMLCVYTFIMTDIMKKDYANVFGYTYFIVKTNSMTGTLEKNDLIFVKIGSDPKVGDIITYVNKSHNIITHRLKKTEGNKYYAQGDVNNTLDEAITKDMIIGVVKGNISIISIFKLVILFVIIFIFLALVNFDKLFEKYIVKDKKTKTTSRVPEEIFEKKYEVDEKSGLTIDIPLEEIKKLNEEKEDVEVLDLEEEVITDNGIVKKALKDKEYEKELINQVVNLLKLKNNKLQTTHMTKKWLIKYQYVYHLALALLGNNPSEIEYLINYPNFDELYDYDLDSAGLYENLRNRVYDMPIYVFLRILAYSILYNDDEFFDGIYKIMKYKSQVDKYGYFRVIKKNDNSSKREVKNLITFMKKIAVKFDKKNVLNLDQIDKEVKDYTD